MLLGSASTTVQALEDAPQTHLQLSGGKVCLQYYMALRRFNELENPELLSCPIFFSSTAAKLYDGGSD